MRLDGDIFLGRDDILRLELVNHCPNVSVSVTNIVFF